MSSERFIPSLTLLLLASLAACQTTVERALARTAIAVRETTPDDDDDASLLEEFFLIENAEAQEDGELQVTLVATHADDDGDVRRQADLLLEYGLSDRWQVELCLPYLWLDPDRAARERGRGDLEFGVMHVLHAGDDEQLSAAFEVAVPTGDEDADLGEGEYAFEPRLLYLTRVGEAGVFANLGGEYADGEAFLTYGVGLVQPLGDWAFTGELAGERGEGEHDVSLAVGALWHGWDDTEIGLGVPLGLGGDAEDWGVILMFTHEQ